MPIRRGEFLFRDTPAETTLTDEQRVFIACVEDVLRSTPGLRYAMVRDPVEMIGTDPTAYALFLIQTNPEHDIALAVELTDRSFVVRLNGLAFIRRRGAATSFETWADRRCRDLERMVTGDLRLVQQTLMNLPLASTLEAGTEERWHKIGHLANGWLALVSFFIPYAFLLNGSKQRLYCDWFECGGD